MHWRRPRKVSDAGRLYRVLLLPALLGALLALGLAQCARAQEPGLREGMPGSWACGARQEIVRDLKQKYGEEVAGRGMTGGSALIELFAGPEGSWTLVLSFPGGRSCAIVAGEGWEPVERKKGREI